MEHQQTRNAIRQPPQTEHRRPEKIPESQRRQQAVRAAAILRMGGDLTQLRGEDLLALGHLLGNSALTALLAERPLPVTVPFVPAPSAEPSRAVPVQGEPLALEAPPAPLPESENLTAFPASVLTGGATTLTGGVYGQSLAP